MELLVKITAIVFLDFLVVIGTIYTGSDIFFSAIANTDLLETSCQISKDQCQQFQDPANKIISTCIERQCQCTKNDKLIDCVPNNGKMNNIISGPCPCTMPFSQCRKDSCICNPQYIPSKDLRRCVSYTANLYDYCDFDKQCQETDSFAICNGTKRDELNRTNRICNCKNGFIEFNRQCLSIVGIGHDNDSSCIVHWQCEKFGKAFCHKETNQCICNETKVSSPHSSKCLPPSRYKLDCQLDEQCQHQMGMGAMCYKEEKDGDEMGLCLCKQPFIMNQTYKNSTIFCATPVGLGDFCREDEDCFYPDFETLQCFFGTCKCRDGYKSINSTHCINRGYKLNANLGFMYSVSCVYIFSFLIYNS